MLLLLFKASSNNSLFRVAPISFIPSGMCLVAKPSAPFLHLLFVNHSCGSIMVHHTFDPCLALLLSFLGSHETFTIMFLIDGSSGDPKKVEGDLAT